MSDFAQQALEELQKVTGSDNRDNPWLGVVAAVYLWHARIEQLTKACEALLDAHDQSFVGRKEMRDLYYSAHPRRAAAYKQARKAIESVRGIEASYPDPNCEAAARERDAAYEDSRQMQNRLQRLIDGKPQQDVIDALNALCDKQAAILSRVAVALRGPEPPQTRWSHHDLPERAAAVVRERDEWEAKYHTVHQHNTMLQEHDYELSVKAEELADLRARIEARLAFCEGSIERGGIIRTADEARWLRALLAEKEAK